MQQGSAEFNALLSLSPEFNEGYFFATTTPNTGYMIFKERYLLFGLTTQGVNVLSDYYVSEFSVQTNSSGPENLIHTNVCQIVFR